MNDITRNRLSYAGWKPDRKIDISFIKKKYEEINLEMPRSVQAFLEQYAMIKVAAQDMNEDVEFDPLKAIGINLDGMYFREVLEEYDIKETAYPIGIACRGNLSVFMTKDNVFYCFTDGYLEKDGDNVGEMLNCLVGECRKADIILKK